MLTVITVLFRPASVMKTTANTATYTAEWADKLYRGCKRNLTEPFRFVCITDHDQEEFKEPIEAVPFLHQEHVGTWMCINEIFRPDLEIEHGLFMGLDTVICKNIDALVGYEGRFCMVKHPRFPQKMMNAITLFSGEHGAEMWKRYIKDPAKAIEESKTRYWVKEFGSEMLWWEAINPYCCTIDRVCPDISIRSYKIENAHLDGAHIIYWHAAPKPPTAREPIVTENWV